MRFLIGCTPDRSPLHSGILFNFFFSFRSTERVRWGVLWCRTRRDQDALPPTKTPVIGRIPRNNYFQLWKYCPVRLPDVTLPLQSVKADWSSDVISKNHSHHILFICFVYFPKNLTASFFFFFIFLVKPFPNSLSLSIFYIRRRQCMCISKDVFFIRINTCMYTFRCFYVRLYSCCCFPPLSSHVVFL